MRCDSACLLADAKCASLSQDSQRGAVLFAATDGMHAYLASSGSGCARDVHSTFEAPQAARARHIQRMSCKLKRGKGLRIAAKGGEGVKQGEAERPDDSTYCTRVLIRKCKSGLTSVYALRVVCILIPTPWDLHPTQTQTQTQTRTSS